MITKTEFVCPWNSLQINELDVIARKPKDGIKYKQSEPKIQVEPIRMRKSSDIVSNSKYINASQVLFFLINLKMFEYYFI